MNWLADLANALFNAPPMQGGNVGLGGEFFIPEADVPEPPAPPATREKSRKPALTVRRVPMGKAPKKPFS